MWMNNEEAKEEFVISEPEDHTVPSKERRHLYTCTLMCDFI